MEAALYADAGARLGRAPGGRGAVVKGACPPVATASAPTKRP